METYLMMETSYESDEQFLDNMAEESLTNPDYMSEEDDVKDAELFVKLLDKQEGK